MLPARRKQLIRAIIIKILIVLILLAANMITGLMAGVRMQERKIYQSILTRYPDIVYDKRLSRIAETCAKTGCLEGTNAAQDIKILENEAFVKLYSTNAVVAKYAWKSDTDETFTNVFLQEMQEKYHETDDCLKKCQYVGIGKYHDCIFLLACYEEN